MKISATAVLALASSLLSFETSVAFSPSTLTSQKKAPWTRVEPSVVSRITVNKKNNKSPSPLYSQLQEEETVAEKSEENEAVGIDPDAEGLPWWWDAVWKLEVMQTGEPGTEVTFGDSANVLRTNIEQIYGGYPSKDGCPLAEGAIDDIGDGTMFIGLERYYKEYGSPYKLCFGPK